MSGIIFRRCYRLLVAAIIMQSISTFAISTVRANNQLPGSPENTVTFVPTPTPFANPTTTTITTSTTALMSCEYNRIGVNFEDSTYSDGIDYRAGSSPQPDCVNDKLNAALEECNRLYQSYLTTNPTTSFFSPQEIDNCIAYLVFGSRQHGIDTSSSNLSWYTLTRSYDFNNQSMRLMDILADFRGRFDNLYSFLDVNNFDSWSPFATNKVQSTNYTSLCSGSMFFRSCSTHRLFINDQSSYVYIKENSDGSCTPILEANLPAGVNACYAGSYYWKSSPISLIVDDKVDLDHDLRIVKFSLDASNPDHFSIWKASKQAPLLVYDPEHTGVIKSAFQLFGDWSFGGRKTAYRNHDMTNLSDLSPVLAGSEWENGYEALATLDENNDNEISGNELAPIALWYDNNRDAVSDPGEVIPITKTDITALYYKWNRKEQSTNTLIAEKGFLRTTNGKKSIGKSVDWRGDTAATKGELIRRHLGTTTNTIDKTKYESSRETNNLTVNDSTQSHSNLDEPNRSNGTKYGSSLNGLWKWTADDSSNPSGLPDGYLSFSDTEDGKLTGHSYTAFGIRDNRIGFSHILSNISFAGNRNTEENGAIKFKFVMFPEEGSRIESEATYLVDRQEIIGKSVAKVSLGTKPLDLTYRWRARRITQASLSQTKNP